MNTINFISRNFNVCIPFLKNGFKYIIKNPTITCVALCALGLLSLAIYSYKRFKAEPKTDIVEKNKINSIKSSPFKIQTSSFLKKEELSDEEFSEEEEVVLVPVFFADLPFHLRTLQPLNQDHLARIQKTLDEQNIPLNCQNPSQLIHPNFVKAEVVGAHLNFLKTQPEWYEIKKRVFENLDKITFQELMSGLSICCDELNRLLVDKDYTLLFYKYKSHEWMASFALPQLKKQPQQCLWTDTLVISDITKQFKLEDYTFVIFDDITYSGSQLFQLCRSLNSQAEKDKRKYKVYLVIPFMTDEIKKIYSTSYWKEIEIHIITTTRQVKTLNTIFNQNEIKDVLKRYNDKLSPLICELWDEETWERQLKFFGKKTLTFTEWKVPDTTSMWEAIQNVEVEEKQRTSVFTSFDPPYFQSQ